jgi:hypothetical protein
MARIAELLEHRINAYQKDMCFEMRCFVHSMELVMSRYRLQSRRQWPRGLRRRSAAAWLLGSRVPIPLGAWMFVSCVYMLCCPV